MKSIDNMKNQAIKNLEGMNTKNFNPTANKNNSSSNGSGLGPLNNQQRPSTNNSSSNGSGLGPLNNQQRQQPSNISSAAKDENSESMKDLGKSMMGALSKSFKENAASKETSKDKKDADDIVEEMVKKQRKTSPAKK